MHHGTVPGAHNSIVHYDSGKGSSLKKVLIKSIKNSNKSIHLRTYSFTDQDILSALKEKGEKGVHVSILYDKKASVKLNKIQYSNIVLLPKQFVGLYHQKLWVFDQTTVFFGSTNLTPSSLEIHDNSMVGIYDPEIALSLEQNTSGSKTFERDWGKLTYHFLPSKLALLDVLDTLDQARKKIDISLFTFTHFDIAQKLVELAHKGIKVTVIIDRSSANGASKKIRKFLELEGIKVKQSNGFQLFHHKRAIIDDKIYIIGSANWTKAAFSKNKDILFIFLNE